MTKDISCPQKIIWNGQESIRKQDADTPIWDGSIEQCKFPFYCKTCKRDVVMEKASMYEDDDGNLRTRCKCPICHKWSWLPK